MKEEKELVNKPVSDALENFSETLPEISYTKIKPFDKKIEAKLRVDLSEDDIEIRPDGIIFFPEIKYRKVLLDAFGPGGFALKIHRIYIQGNTVCAHCFLFAQGRFVSEAIGEADYFPNNPQMTYASCVESAKSNALMRCCKDLGIAYKLWDPVYIKDFRKRMCIKVWVTNLAKEGKYAGTTKQHWRKKTDDPIDQWPWIENSLNNNVAPPKEEKPVEERKFTTAEMYEKKLAIIRKAISENDFEAIGHVKTQWQKIQQAFKTPQDKKLYAKLLTEIESAMKKINEQLDLFNSEN